MVRPLIKDLARQRMVILFNKSLSTVKTNPELAKRYIEIALAISRKSGVPVPRQFRMSYCKKCHSFLIPGLTARVRLRGKGKKRLVIKCFSCGRIFRYPYER
jgi:ribonuclease P protein subunit RPR2